MTKKEIIDTVAANIGMTSKDVGVVVNEMLEVLKSSVKSGENVYLRGFGTFRITVRAAKTARDIHRNTAFPIPAQKTVKFIPSPELAHDVSKLDLD